MKRSEINSFIKNSYNKFSDAVLAAKTGLSENAVRHRRRSLNLKRDASVVENPIEDLREETRLHRFQRENKNEKARSKKLMELLEEVEQQRDSVIEFAAMAPEPFEIEAAKGKGGEATLVAVASDWHIEERVASATVNGLNEHNLEIAKSRAERFFSTLARLVKIEQENTQVKNLILALLGDFITNDIHEEMREITDLRPSDALWEAQNLIISGIKHLLQETDVKLTIVCHSGNHARTTKDVFISTENGHSLETFMYRNMAKYFENETRVSFIIPDGYLSYVDVYDTTLCFHHGHAVNFGGGIGGLTIPMNKAIAQWNKNRKADIYVCGHFHQAIDGGNFIVNGSSIGYNAYALRIKASYEKPAQVMFGIHSRMGKYVTRLIYVES